MAVDEQSSQDSTLIDDDLVAALGFEPVASVETANGDIAIDDVDVVEDLVVDEVPMGDISTIGDLDGFGINEVDDSVADEIVDDVSVDEISVDDAAIDDLASDDVASDDVASDDVASDDLASDDVAIDEVEIADLEIADLEIADLEIADLEAADLDVADVDVSGDVVESDLDAVPSISDDDLDVDATAPVALVDLDLDTEDVTTDDLKDLDTPNLDDPDVSDLDVGDLEAVDVDAIDGDVIDLDTVDLSDPAPDEVAPDELSAQGFADAEVQELADADSVFADATPVLDPPAFDDPIGLPATGTVGQVGSGLLDLETAEETTGTAAVATAATATATKGRRRLRARKSRRVIRHIDPWSVLTFSVLFHMVVFAALLLSSVLVWNAAIASGMVENIESFIQELGDYETFEINADVMFRAAIIIAGMLTLASSVLVVLLTVVFNLISDLVGGIRVTVIEEETVRVPIDKKRSKARNE